MNRVNIIMAAYNGEKYIEEQIDSITKNGFTNWKLWIFDDGSTDKTSSIVAKYIALYPEQIHYYINEKNKGVNLNFLEGLKFAAEVNNNSTDKVINYYSFCDQDDVWMPDKLEKTLKRMKKTEKKFGTDIPIAVFTDAVVVDENIKIIHASFFEQSKLDTKKTDLSHIMMENKLIGCTVMINQAVLNKLDNIPAHSRYHDWWVAMIAAAFGHISYLPEATLCYRQHSNNIVGNQDFLSYVKNRITSLQKQKETLIKIELQAKEFYEIYHVSLSEKAKQQVYYLANIKKYNWLKRRILLLQYGYMKTGILRNLGLLLLI